jgi:hypothetical protein
MRPGRQWLRIRGAVRLELSATISVTNRRRGDAVLGCKVLKIFGKQVWPTNVPETNFGNIANASQLKDFGSWSFRRFTCTADLSSGPGDL